MSNIRNILLICAFLCTGIIVGKAQQNTDSLPSLKSPYHTIMTHLHFLQEKTYEIEKAALVIPPAFRDGEEQERAIKLKRIMDGRGLFILMGEVPDQPDYRDSSSKRAVYIMFPDRAPEIYVERKDGQWYYSRETMDRLDALYKATFPYGLDRVVDMFPVHEVDRFLGLTAWQWGGLGILLLLAFAMYWIARWVLRPIVSLIRRFVVHKFPLQQDEMRRLVHLLGLISAFRLVQIFLPALQFPVNVSEYIILGLKIAQTVLAVLLMLAATKFLHRYLAQLAEKTESKTDDQLLPIGIKLLNAGLIIFGLFHALSLMDVNVTAIIAGVSIGGLALALAAQDTVKNFIGSLMIIVDKPFQVGDYIATGDLEGTVTEVGFRTSRIMMIDTSIISIPNGQLADSRITNLGVRPMRMISMQLGVMYNTPPEKIEEFIEGIKAIVIEHPIMVDEPLYVHLHTFADSSINIFFRSYINVLTFPEELKIRGEVMFSILRLAHRIGVSFAFPSTSLYVEQMPEKE